VYDEPLRIEAADEFGHLPFRTAGRETRHEHGYRYS
jgi:hypothetical protein